MVYLSSRDASISDLRATSGALPRNSSYSEKLSSSFTRDRDTDAGQHIRKDSFNGSEPRFQSGVLRTNCIDCLDRTNVAQYAYGLEALGRQLQAMEMSDEPKVDPDSSIAVALMEMYQGMGDALAQQYGGSAAHNTVCILYNQLMIQIIYRTLCCRPDLFLYIRILFFFLQYMQPCLYF